MKSVCIKSNNKYIIDYLLKDFSKINIETIYISSHKFKIYDNVIVHYLGDDIPTFNKIFCDILTRCIIFFYERKITKSIINYNYFYFNDMERNQILDNCIESFLYDDELNNKKYESIFQSLLEYIENHHSIVLNGFVNFRLQNYRKILDENTDICVSNFLIEREYYEFINILHLYINSKSSNEDVIHLVYTNKDSILLDENKNVIPTDEHLLNAKYLSDISFSSNDYCLNTLLNLLPR